MNTTPGYNSNPLRLVQTFGTNPNVNTALDKSAKMVESLTSTSGSPTAITMLTGTDFTKDLPTVTNADQFGDRAGVNVEAAATVSGKSANLDQRRENFKTAVEDMQRPLREALEQGAENLGYEQSAADASYKPIVKTEMSDVIMDAGMAKVGLQAISTATSVADGISDARAIAGKLTPEQEAKLADQMRTLLTPTRDSLTGEVTAPPAIANNFDQDFLEKASDQELVQVIKQALLPPEDQPEWEEFMAAEARMDLAEANHGRNQGVNDAVLALADASGDEASIEVMEMDAEDRVNFVADTLALGSGGMVADAQAISRINVAVFDASVAHDMIRDGADVRDTPDGAFANEPDQKLLAANIGAGLMG